MKMRTRHRRFRQAVEYHIAKVENLVVTFCVVRGLVKLSSWPLLPVFKSGTIANMVGICIGGTQW